MAEAKKLIALGRTPLNLGRIVRRLKIICDGDCGQKDCSQRAKCDELDRDRGKQGSACRATTASEPGAPKDDGYGEPSKIADQFHGLPRLYPRQLARHGYGRNQAMMARQRLTRREYRPEDRSKNRILLVEERGAHSRAAPARASKNFVRMPLVAGQQTGGNIITLDHLRLRIPVHMVLRLHGNPMQQASGTGAMTNLCRRDWRFS